MAHVDDLKPHDAPINLVEYDPQWPQQFLREADRIRSILDQRALQIEHVGSTSIPGLVAKPIIDILLVVTDSADEQTYLTPLEASGYKLTVREPEWHQHRLLKGPDTNINLHVFTIGSTEIERMLLLRDWLRESLEDRELYATEKRKLARQKWHYVQNYADAKSKVVEHIMTRAKASRSSMSSKTVHAKQSGKSKASN